MGTHRVKKKAFLTYKKWFSLPKKHTNKTLITKHLDWMKRI